MQGPRRQDGNKDTPLPPSVTVRAASVPGEPACVLVCVIVNRSDITGLWFLCGA